MQAEPQWDYDFGVPDVSLPDGHPYLVTLYDPVTRDGQRPESDSDVDLRDAAGHLDPERRAQSSPTRDPASMNQDWSPNPPKNTPGPFDYVHQLFSHLDISDNPGSSPQIGHRTVPSPSQDGLRRWQFDDTARDRAAIGWSYDVSYDPNSMNFSRIRMAPSRRLVLPGTFPPILRTHREGPLANRRPSLLPPTVLDWLDEEIEAVQATVEDIALEDEPPPLGHPTHHPEHRSQS